MVRAWGILIGILALMGVLAIGVQARQKSGRLPASVRNFNSNELEIEPVPLGNVPLTDEKKLEQ